MALLLVLVGAQLLHAGGSREQPLLHQPPHHMSLHTINPCISISNGLLTACLTRDRSESRQTRELCEKALKRLEACACGTKWAVMLHMGRPVAS